MSTSVPEIKALDRQTGRRTDGRVAGRIRASKGSSLKHFDSSLEQGNKNIKHFIQSNPQLVTFTVARVCPRTTIGLRRKILQSHLRKVIQN